MKDKILNIKIDQIKESPYQGRLLPFDSSSLDRKTHERLDSLIISIKESGLLSPIVVRTTDSGYELIDGHRRLEAYRLMGKDSIEAIIKESDDRSAQVMSIVANLQRENLTNIELALAFRKVLDAGIFKDQKELSQSIGKNQTFVGDLLGTLKMDKRIIDDLLITKATNDVRLLRAIRKINNTDEEGRSDEQFKLYQEVVEKGLSRTEVLELIKQKKQPKEQVVVKFKPRKIEIDLPGKIKISKRKEYTEILQAQIEKFLAEIENQEISN